MTQAAWRDEKPGPVSGPTVWRVDLALDGETRERCRTILSYDERARAERFFRAEDRERFIASHAAVRTILAHALATAPSELVFETGFSGKPVLGGRWRGRLDFNLSHSGGWALVGLSPDAAIGVDVEVARPFDDALRIARAHFSQKEVAVLATRSGEALTSAFFACWTRKEAFVKALGLGLSMRLDRFSVAIPPEPPALLELDGDAETARRWSLLHLDPAPGHVGAVVIGAADTECALRSLAPRWSASAG